MNPKRLFSSLAALLVGLGVVGTASAQETGHDKDIHDRDYCDKVQARAHADAWLLFSPSLQVQGIKYPAGAPGVVAVGGSETPGGYQVRSSLLWSPLDAYKGTVEQAVANKDCLQHSAMVDAQNLLEMMNDVGRAPALQAEVTYLKFHADDMNDILTNVHKRLVIGHSTIIELAAVQAGIDLLERKLAAAQGQLSLIETKDYVVTPRSSTEIVERLQRYSMEYEKETARLRSIDPWAISVSGGVVPPMGDGGSAAWFGMVTVQYNFGGFVRGADESKYLSARQHELQYARYELADQVRRLQDGIQVGIESADAEIVTLDKRISELNDLCEQLKLHIEAPNAMSTLGVVELQHMDAVSDRLYLIELRRQLSAWK